MLVSLGSHPACCSKDGRHLVECRDDCIRLVIINWFAARATANPNGAETKLPCRGEIKMRARTDVQEIVNPNVEARPSVTKNLAGRLVSTSLLGRDNAVD